MHGLLYYILWFCQASDTKYCKYPIAAQKVPFYCVPAEARNKEGKYGILPDVEKKGLNSTDVKVALDFAAKLNREYFAGKVTATKNDKGWSIWENNLKDLSFYSYLNSILKDGVSDNTYVAF